MTTMKAIRIHAYGGVENLHYDDVLRPEPQAGQVLVRVYAAGVNPLDWKIREGYFKQMFDYPLPVIIGQDIAGVVAAVATGVMTLHLIYLLQQATIAALTTQNTFNDLN